MTEPTEHDMPATAERRNERGANLVEYALLIALIAVVCVGAVTLLGESTAVPYSSISSGIAN